MHVLMPVDVIGRKAGGVFEETKLPRNLARDFLLVDTAGKRAEEDLFQAGKASSGSQRRHGPERLAERQIEMETNGDAIARLGNGFGVLTPPVEGHQGAGRRQSARPGELQYSSRYAGRHRVVVGAENNRRCHGQSCHALRAPLCAVCAVASEAVWSVPIVSDTMNSGRPLTSS